MSVTIRLSRIGKKNSPSYRIVVVEKRSKRDGESLDILGSYNPSEDSKAFKIDQDRLKDWQSKGAIMSNAVKLILEGKYTYTKYEPNKKKEESKPDAEAKSE